LRQVLSRHVGIAPEELEFQLEACPNCGGPHGRPALAGADRSVQFSLSHSGDLVLVAVAGVPIGVDVEELSEEQVAADLSTRLHPAEQREITAADQPRLAFTRVWTRKEAYLKGIGIGLSRGLRADYLGGTGLAALPAGWSVLDVPVPDGYAAAVAVLDGAPDLRVLELSPAVVEGNLG
jgi:4'-phosphopantetheinyl transferase